MKTICIVCMLSSDFSGHPIFYMCFELRLLLLCTLGNIHGSHQMRNNFTCDIAAIVTERRHLDGLIGRIAV
jgi:hypothetical protein